MGEIAAILTVALVGGLVASQVRLPPLVGFLVAGFALNASGVAAPAELATVADLGVTLLLFGIGLKLDLRVLIRREVWVTASTHLVASSLVGAAYLGLLGIIGVGLLRGESWQTLLLVGFALSFSSTVFVVKQLEDRSSGSSLSARSAIGILVVQDLAAVAFLAVEEGTRPSLWALTLLLLVPGSQLIRPALSRLGHAELRPLFGLAAALVPGYILFEAVGLKGDLGALVIGVLLAPYPGSGELSKGLFSVKELLLVGFFVSIGFTGLPTWDHLLLGLALLALLPLKALGFAVLLWAHGLRRRTSVRTATMLGNFSEFGLIVAVAASTRLGEPWPAVLATAVAASFILSAIASRASDTFVDVARRFLPDRRTERLHPDDRPIDVGDAEAVVLGMGRVGRAAYHRLAHDYDLRVLGVESLPARQRALADEGFNIVQGDATDPEFWVGIRPQGVRLAVLAMPFHSGNLEALRNLHSRDFAGKVAIVTQYDEDLSEAIELGADTGFQIYEGVGSELADCGAAEAGFVPRDD